MVGLPAALFVACGGAVVATDPEPNPATTASPGDRPKPTRPPRDASKPNVDAAPADCACSDEIEQIQGTCSFIIGRKLVACVAEHSADGGTVTLSPRRACLKSDGPPSWTPSAKPNELDLCSCVPGEKHTLCLRYLD